MKYFINEMRVGFTEKRNASFKPHDDTNVSLSRLGFNNLDIFFKETSDSKINKIIRQFSIFKKWKNAMKKLQKGDVVVIQQPTIYNSYFFPKLFRELKKRGVHTIFLIHDIRTLREKDGLNKLRYHFIKKFQEDDIYASMEIVIAHNQRMKNFLIDRGIEKNKLVDLKIFDQLMPKYNEERISKRKIKITEPIIFAGDLSKSKAGFLYSLPGEFKMNIYGPNYSGESGSNKKLMGSFPPDDLPYNLEGSFGLVWDGKTADSCSGGFGEYLKYNNPFKASMYLSCGIPIITWKESALADFVKENSCGIIVDSIFDAYKIIDNMNNEEYLIMKKNAEDVGTKMRKGYFLEKAITEALNKINDFGEAN